MGWQVNRPHLDEVRRSASLTLPALDWYREVLRYLPTNLSPVEIASELCVSRNTVSTHIRSIYAKLGVQDRSSAVRCARGLRLLSAGRTQ